MGTSSKPDLTFHISISDCIYATTICLLPLWLVTLPIFFFLSPRVRYLLSWVIAGWTLILVGMVIASVCYVVLQPSVVIKTGGIRGRTFWETPFFVGWEEITMVKGFNLLGSHYWRVFFHSGSPPLWIPLSLVHYNRFVAAVIERAPATNPLRQAVETGDLRRTYSSQTSTKNLSVTPVVQPSESKLNSGEELLTAPVNDSQPWMQPHAFPVCPDPNSYGYLTGGQMRSCCQVTLLENLQGDTNRAISLVWVPHATHLVVPEEVPNLFEAVTTRDRQHYQQGLKMALGLSLGWGVLMLLSLRQVLQVQFFLLMLFFQGLMPLVENGWLLYRLRSDTPVKMARRVSEKRYWVWVGQAKAPWTNALVNCITLVGLAQLIGVIQSLTGQTSGSIAAAGIVKEAVRQGETWRLLTGTLLHGNVLHFIFNMSALLALGKLLEISLNWVYVPLVFIISAWSGSLFSLYLLPGVTSVGASGGILGLLGFLLILGWRQKHVLPPNFGRTLLLSVIYIAVSGMIAHQIIDNAGHLGGFLAGSGLGMLLVPKNSPSSDTPASLRTAGIGASIMIATTAIICLWKIFVPG